MKQAWLGLVWAGLVLAGVPAAIRAGDGPDGGGKPRLGISDFQDAKDRDKWDNGDAGAVEITLEPRAKTDANVLMKVVFKNGEYPGFSLKNVPADWSKYEAISWTVYTDVPYALNIRIDDSKSTDYKSQFNKTIKLDKGSNLCQIKVEDVARVLNAKEIKKLILFTVKPPAGLAMWFDDVQLGPLLSEQVPFIPYAERMDMQPTLAVVTPHFEFAKNLAGGPLKAFVMSGISGGREVPELMQRLDLQVSLQTWDRNWDINTWGMGDFYGKRGHAFDRVLMQKYFASSMQGPEKFDVIVMPTPIGWKEFSPAAREALIKRVNDGAGLVLVMPFPGEDAWPEDLKGLSALINSDSDRIDPTSGYVRYGKTGQVKGSAWKAAGEHAITAGVPFEAVPFARLSYQKYELAPGAQAVVVSAAGDPIVAVRQVGKGRVVTCAWRGSPLLPEVAMAQDEGAVLAYRYWEPLYSMMSRAICWAGQREFVRAGEPVAVDAKEQADPNLQAMVWKDAAGKTTDWALRFTAPGATGVQTVQVMVQGPPKPGEKKPVDLLGRVAYLRRSDSLTVQILPPAMDENFKIDWTVTLCEQVAGHWRTLESTQAAPDKADAAAGIRCALSTAKVRQILAIVKVEGKADGKLYARGQAEVIVTPPGSAWDDFEVFMWPVDGLPYLREYEDGLMSQIGSTGVMDTDWSNAGRRLRWARAGLRILPHDVDVRPLHIRPYNFGEIAKKYKDGDKNALVRPNSFADPAFWDAAKKRVTAAAEQLAPFHIPAYVLCDEPSLTSYREAFDFDFHPANIALFRKSLEGQFKTIAALNDALGTKEESFDKIQPPTTDEAKKSGNWGLWNAWRAHNDTVMADAYKTYRDTLRAVDPQARISISGTQTANPYDGFDWGKLSPYFDAMSGYGYSEQERIRLSFYPGTETMRNATPAGYGNSGKGVQYQLWSQLCNHGAGHVLFWWVSFRNPDLTFCKSAMDYQKGFAELEGGIGRQYMQGKRYTSPVAIQYSMNSMRAAWATGKFDEYEKAMQQAVDRLVAEGLDPVFVSDEQIAAGDLVQRGFKTVVLPYPLSLGQGKKAGGLDVTGGLTKFIAGGGAAITMADPQFDEFLQKATPDAAVWTKVQKFETAKDKLGATLAAAGAKP
ncbi:MAG TPA: beta-galactosidase, partial [Planctomycetota bacterium]|nr:beta-galactosidase [Planctomycetota bacterium]